MASDSKDIKPFIKELVDLRIVKAEYPTNMSECNMAWEERLQHIRDSLQTFRNLEIKDDDHEMRQGFILRLQVLEERTVRESHLSEKEARLSGLKHILLQTPEFRELVGLQGEIKETVKLAKTNKTEMAALFVEINQFLKMARRHHEQQQQLQTQIQQYAAILEQNQLLPFQQQSEMNALEGLTGFSPNF